MRDGPQPVCIEMAEGRTDVSVREEDGTPGNGTGSAPADRVLKTVQELQTWYAAEFERRLAAVSEILHTQLKSQIKEGTGVAQPPLLNAPIVDASSREKLLEEIQRTEEVANKCASELERMVADDAVNLGLLLQMRNQQLEVKAYLRGLRYSIDGASSARPANPKST